MHIVIFAGFLILALRALALLYLGLSPCFVSSGWPVYGIIRHYAATDVVLAVVAAVLRRLTLRPARYRQTAVSGYRRRADPIFVLALIGILMVADGFFEGSRATAEAQSLP